MVAERKLQVYEEVSVWKKDSGNDLFILRKGEDLGELEMSLGGLAEDAEMLGDPVQCKCTIVRPEQARRDGGREQLASARQVQGGNDPVLVEIPFLSHLSILVEGRKNPMVLIVS